MLRFLFASLICLFISCSDEKNKPDVSHIRVDIQIDRFEKAFFAMDTSNVAAGLADVRNAFPSFYPFFLQQVLQLNPADPAMLPVVSQIVRAYRPINDSIQKKYTDLTWLDEELTEAFRYVKYYYPDYRVPRIITFLGTFDAPGAVMTPEYLGIGLHQYAGKQFSVYADEQLLQVYPAYISRRFDREYITPNSMKAVADDIYPDMSAGRPLIEQMVEKGKHWFLVDRFIPDAPDSVKTGYTGKQLEWVKNSEGTVWAFLVKNEDLYSIEPHVIQAYIGESPFTQGMTENSPGNIGQWVGWRIVEQYASKNDHLTPQQIVQTPARTIFEGASYRPK